MQNNSNTVKISLVVSIYNGEKYIEKCINSIYAQKFDDYEIIFVNDGSTDKTLEMCNAYAEKDNRITVVSKENGGLGSARNAGMKIAKGEYITFPDVDDWLEPDYCSALYKLAKQADYDIVVSGANNYSPDFKYIGSANYKCMRFETNKDCWDNIMSFFPTTLLFDVVWNKLYRLDFLKKNQLTFTDLRRCQDAYFNLEAFDCLNTIATTDKAYYNYLNNSVEKVNIKFPKNYIDINIAYYLKLKQVFKAHHIYNGDIKKHYDTSFVETLFGTINMYDNPKWQLSKKQQKEYIEEIFKKSESSGFLTDPLIRDDAVWKYALIKEKNTNAIMRYHRREALKDTFRGKKFLKKTYDFLRKINRKYRED